MNAGKSGSVLVFGSVNVDLVAEVERIPKAGETILASRGARYFGGKGANQAVAAARARRALETRVLLAGSVGADALGEDSLTNLRANGVETTLMRRSARPTGFACIAVDNRGENAITVVPGANLDAASSQVSDETLAACPVLVMQLEIPTAEVVALARRARAVGVRCVVNFAPIPDSASPEMLADLMEVADITIFNQHELTLISEQLGLPASHGHIESAPDLARRFSADVVVTLSAEGAMIASSDGTTTRLPGVPADAIDTTGAGDTFVGVLAVTLAEGASLRDAAERANRAAACACQAKGAQSGMPKAEEIDAMATVS